MMIPIQVGDYVQVKADAAFGYPRTRKVFEEAGMFGVVEEIPDWGFPVRVSAVSGKDYDYFNEHELIRLEHAPETKE